MGQPTPCPLDGSKGFARIAGQIARKNAEVRSPACLGIAPLTINDRVLRQQSVTQLVQCNAEIGHGTAHRLVAKNVGQALVLGNGNGKRGNSFGHLDGRQVETAASLYAKFINVGVGETAWQDGHAIGISLPARAARQSTH